MTFNETWHYTLSTYSEMVIDLGFALISITLVVAWCVATYKMWRQIKGDE
jgi:hypothetical protein